MFYFSFQNFFPLKVDQQMKLKTYRMKDVLFYCLTLVLFSLVACNSFHTGDKSTFKIVPIENLTYIPTGGVLSYGIVNDDMTKMIDQRTYHIKDKEKFILNLMVANKADQDKDFLIVPIVDFQNNYNNNRFGLERNIPVNLKAKTAAAVPISINSLNEGIHDVLFLIVRDPNGYNEETRRRNELNHLVGVRVSIIVENEKKPSIQYTQSSVEDNKALNGIFLSENIELKQWPMKDATNKNEIDYKVQVGSTGESNYEYAVIGLYNWDVVPINETNEVIFGKLEPNSKAAFNGKVKLSKSKNGSKTSDFTTILVPDPFSKVDRFRTPDIEPSIRLGILE